MHSRSRQGRGKVETRWREHFLSYVRTYDYLQGVTFNTMVTVSHTQRQ